MVSKDKAETDVGLDVGYEGEVVITTRRFFNQDSEWKVVSFTEMSKTGRRDLKENYLMNILTLKHLSDIQAILSDRWFIYNLYLWGKVLECGYKFWMSSVYRWYKQWVQTRSENRQNHSLALDFLDIEEMKDSTRIVRSCHNKRMKRRLLYVKETKKIFPNW